MPDYNWITSNVALGSAPTASDIPRMQSDGITDVLDLRAEADSTAMYAGTGINYHRVPMIDDGRRQPASAYQQGVQIIYNALANPNGRIEINCAAGQYRSPSMVYAYLRSTGMPPDQAWSTIVAARPSVQNQYVSSAEAAVPVLPTGPNMTAGVDNSIWIAFGVALVAGAAAYAWQNRHSFPVLQAA